jgi:hypothetical protein
MLLMELFHAELYIHMFKKLAINIIFAETVVFRIRNVLVRIRIHAHPLPLNYGSGFRTLRFS